MEKREKYVKAYGRCGRCGGTIDFQYNAFNRLVNGELLMCCPTCVRELEAKENVAGPEKSRAEADLEKFNVDINNLVHDALTASVPPVVINGILAYQTYRVNRVIELVSKAREKQAKESTPDFDLANMKITGNA